MTEHEFDPYRKWLGIPPAEQPPNHYRLLGLAIFESDPDVISNAADRQMAHIRTFQGGKYSELSQKILNELSAARVTLLNDEKRRAYDEQLRAKLQGSAQVVQVVGPSMQGGPAVGTPVQGGPMVGTPMQGGPMMGTPMQGTPMMGTPMQGTPVMGTPMQGGPVMGTPVQGTPVMGTPMQGAPIMGTPVPESLEPNTQFAGFPGAETSTAGVSFPVMTGSSGAGESSFPDIVGVNTGNSNTFPGIPPVDTSSFGGAEEAAGALFTTESFSKKGGRSSKEKEDSFVAALGKEKKPAKTKTKSKPVDTSAVPDFASMKSEPKPTELFTAEDIISGNKKKAPVAPPTPAPVLPSDIVDEFAVTTASDSPEGEAGEEGEEQGKKKSGTWLYIVLLILGILAAGTVVTLSLLGVKREVIHVSDTTNLEEYGEDQADDNMPVANPDVAASGQPAPGPEASGTEGQTGTEGQAGMETQPGTEGQTGMETSGTEGKPAQEEVPIQQEVPIQPEPVKEPAKPDTKSSEESKPGKTPAKEKEEEEESSDFKLNFDQEDAEKKPDTSKTFEEKTPKKKDSKTSKDSKDEKDGSEADDKGDKSKSDDKEEKIPSKKPTLDEINALGDGQDVRVSPKKEKMLSFYDAAEDTQIKLSAALYWLAEHQLKDGSWNFNHSLTPSGKQPAKKGQFKNVGIAMDSPNAATALALMAIIGDGKSLKHKKLELAIKKGVIYLAKKASYVTDRPLTNATERAQEIAKSKEASLVEGDFPDFRAHAWSTLVMCELLELTRNDEAYRVKGVHLCAVAAKSLTEHVMRQQNKDGGWPNRERGLSSNNTLAAPTEQNQSSLVATVWNLAALYAAQKAGISVRSSCLTDARKYLSDKVANVESRYPFPKPCDVYPPDITEYLYAAVGLQLMGYPPKRLGMDSILSRAVVPDDFTTLQRSLFISWMARDVRGKIWDDWNEILKQHFEEQVTKGDDRGTWWYSDKASQISSQGGRFYCTAMMAMLMESYFRYPPLRPLKEKSTLSDSAINAAKEKAESKDKPESSARTSAQRPEPAASHPAHPAHPGNPRPGTAGRRGHRNKPEIPVDENARLFEGGLDALNAEQEKDATTRKKAIRKEAGEDDTPKVDEDSDLNFSLDGNRDSSGTNGSKTRGKTKADEDTPPAYDDVL